MDEASGCEGRIRTSDRHAGGPDRRCDSLAEYQVRTRILAAARRKPPPDSRRGPRSRRPSNVPTQQNVRAYRRMGPRRCARHVAFPASRVCDVGDRGCYPRGCRRSVAEPWVAAAVLVKLRVQGRGGLRATDFGGSLGSGLLRVVLEADDPAVDQETDEPDPLAASRRAACSVPKEAGPATITGNIRHPDPQQFQMSGPRGLIEGVFGGRFSRDFGELGGIWGVDRAAGI